MTATGAWPQIGMLHSFYDDRTPSGENLLVDSQVAALRSAGAQVHLLARRTSALAARPAYPLEAAVAVATGHGHDPSAWIARTGVDVVHVHNLFPNFGRRWLRGLDVPVVVTLHNYRAVCASGNLFRDGHVCEDCLTRPSSGLRHGCYRGSRLATLPLTLGQGGFRRDVLERAAAVTVLSPVQAATCVAAGVPADRIVEVPNFVPDALDPGRGDGGEQWVFVGRLTADKGIAAVCREWPAELPLRVVGTGPEQERAMRFGQGKRIEFVGNRPRTEVLATLRRARGLVFASRWRDPFGLVHAEALAAGTPVLSVGPTAASELIGREGCGIVADELTAELVSAAHDRFPALRDRARAVFDRWYTERSHVERLRAVYARVCGA